MQTDGQPQDVESGEIMVLSDNLREPIEAAEDAAFLAMIAWPNGAGGWNEEVCEGRL